MYGKYNIMCYRFAMGLKLAFQHSLTNYAQFASYSTRDVIKEQVGVKYVADILIITYTVYMILSLRVCNF